jgi:hypothetical protein
MCGSPKPVLKGNWIERNPVFTGKPQGSLICSTLLKGNLRAPERNPVPCGSVVGRLYCSSVFNIDDLSTYLFGAYYVRRSRPIAIPVWFQPPDFALNFENKSTII